jgi:hypothetical protein
MLRRFHCRCEVLRFATIAMACAFAFTSVDAAAGELSDIAADVQSGGGHTGGGGDDRDDERDWDPDDPQEETWEDMATRALGGGIAALSSVNSGLEYTAYPYENDHAGYLAGIANPDAATHDYSKRLWAEYGSNFDDIDSVSGGLLVEGDKRLGFDLTWRTYFENVEPNDHDDLSTGDGNLLFRLWQSDATTTRVGGGASWLEFDGELDAGFNFTMSGEMFPVRPIVVTWEWDAGKIGHAALFHGRATIGANLRHFELYTGVDYLDVEDTSITNMITGIRTWW